MIGVCHMTTVHSATDVRILYKEAASLAAAGYDVSLLAPCNEPFEYQNVRVMPAIKTGFGRLKRMLLGSWMIYRKARRLDVNIYHIHDPELILCGLWLKRKGKHVIFDAHEDLPLQIMAKHYIPAWLRKSAARWVAWLQHRWLRRYDAVVVATPSIGQGLRQPDLPIVVVRNLPLLSEFKPVPEMRSKQDRVCYIGGIFKVRGIIPLMKSLPLAGVRLALAGTYSPPELRDELRSMPEWAFVDELGFLDREEVSKLLPVCLAGMVTLLPAPNFLTSLPVKMFEYMASGIPVIASAFPLWKEIISEADCGICVDPHSPEEIAAAIRHLMTHPERAGQMGRHGREAVLGRYHWEVEKDALLELYAALRSEITGIKEKEV